MELSMVISIAEICGAIPYDVLGSSLGTVTDFMSFPSKGV